MDHSNRFLPISQIIVGRRLREGDIRPRRPIISPLFQRRHHFSRLVWCRRHLRINQREMGILFTYDHESRLHLIFSACCTRVYRCFGERFTDGCVVELRPFRGDIVVVKGSTMTKKRTHLANIDGNLNAARYRSEIFHLQVIPFVHGQQWHVPL